MRTATAGRDGFGGNRLLQRFTSHILAARIGAPPADFPTVRSDLIEQM